MTRAGTGIVKPKATSAATLVVDRPNLSEKPITNLLKIILNNKNTRF